MRKEEAVPLWANNKQDGSGEDIEVVGCRVIVQSGDRPESR